MAGDPGRAQRLWRSLLEGRSPGPAEVGLSALPAELRAVVRALVGDLDSLFTALGLREESFAVGTLSRVVAAELASYAPAKNRRRTATNKASVIFVDRTLDLAGKQSSAGMGCHSRGPILTPPGGCQMLGTLVTWCYWKPIFHFVLCSSHRYIAPVPAPGWDCS